MKKILLFVFSITFSPTLYSQLTNKIVIPKIKTDQVADIINIIGSATSNTPIVKSLQYKMYVIKTNPETNNSSRNEQSGRFVLQPNEGKDLSVTSINQNITDKVTVILLVYDTEDNLLGKDRLVVLNDDISNKTEKDREEVVAKEDDYVGFRGIVTEQTKTKPGHDFYKQFYSEYLLRGINGKRVVKIIESISLGRNTVIEIRIDNTLVHQFNVVPRTDFLKQQSNLAIILVSRYFQELEKQQALINQN